MSHQSYISFGWIESQLLHEHSITLSKYCTTISIILIFNFLQKLLVIILDLKPSPSTEILFMITELIKLLIDVNGHSFILP